MTVRPQLHIIYLNSLSLVAGRNLAVSLVLLPQLK